MMGFIKMDDIKDRELDPNNPWDKTPTGRFRCGGITQEWLDSVDMVDWNREVTENIERYKKGEIKDLYTYYGIPKPEVNDPYWEKYGEATK